MRLPKAIPSASYNLTMIAIGMAMAMPVSAQTVDEIMDEYYPIYNESKQCRGIIANNGSTGLNDEPYQSGYCVEIDRQLKVNTPHGKRLYILTTGDVAFNKDGSETSGSHADTGLVGMFVLKPDTGKDKNGWAVEYANPTSNAGSFGNGLTDWKLIQVAPEYWGFINIHGDSHGSVSFAEYILLTPDPDSKRIVDSHITAKSTFENNPFAPSGCSKDRNIYYCTKIKAKLGVDKTVVKNGFYPLKITVNGFDYGHDASIKRTFDNDVYMINYTPTKGYVEPEDDVFN